MIKTIIRIALCSFLLSGNVLLNECLAQSKVSECMELAGITFALAGVPEYCQSLIPEYKEDIKEYFTPYEMTPQIDFVRELNQVHGIGSIAVASLSQRIFINDKGTVCLSPEYNLDELSGEWTDSLITEYIYHLNVFYKESRFNDFFVQHRNMYEEAENALNQLVETLKEDWFDDFFGQRSSDIMDIDIIPGLVSGPHNYAVDSAVIIGAALNDSGKIAISNDARFILVHELCHHFTGNLFKEYWPGFKKSAESIYPHISIQMSEIGYQDAYTAFLEWFNNLCALMFLQETDNDYYGFFQYSLTSQGFLWIDRSVDFMRNFYDNRNIYRNISDFMPQLVSFLEFVSHNFEYVKSEYEHSFPYILNIFPSGISDWQYVDKVVITFSEPMLGSYGFLGWPEGTLPIPLEDCWWLDEYHFILKLDNEMISNDAEYGVKLDPAFFISTRYYPLNNDFTNLTF